MFRATFLGNHGWLIAGRRAHLLIDPLLHPAYGWTPALGLHVWPPCTVRPAAFPPIDAILLTHEHEGHFDIASLHLCDRAIPIYVSALSSLAMRDALGEMGFAVHPLHPGDRFEAGDLDVQTLACDQVRALAEEWDNLALLVYDRGGDGSLFTPVDMAPTQAMRGAVEKLLPRPGLWAHPNNYAHFRFQHQAARFDGTALHRLVENIMGYHRKLSDGWQVPEALLIYGAGYCFGGERAWINKEVFGADSRDAARVLSAMLPGERVLAPIPGETFAMEGGRLGSVATGAPFLEALPTAEWPPRGYARRVEWLEDYGPACGRTEFPAADRPALEEELAGFAGFLYGNFPFRRLYSLRAAEVGARKPTLALRLRAGAAGGALVFEYQPQACRFAPVECRDPAAEYIEVYECWATDLLALLRAQIASPSIAPARSRHYSAGEELFDVDMQLMKYAHPLRQPARFLELYRRVIAEQAPGAAPIRGTGR